MKLTHEGRTVRLVTLRWRSVALVEQSVTLQVTTPTASRAIQTVLCWWTPNAGELRRNENDPEMLSNHFMHIEKLSGDH